MQTQQVETEKKELSGEFEQCPVCESYSVSENNRQYLCECCGVDWVPVRNWD
jgi:uncharacterized Zn ribbon protein